MPEEKDKKSHEINAQETQEGKEGFESTEGEPAVEMIQERETEIRHQEIPFRKIEIEEEGLEKESEIVSEKPEGLRQIEDILSRGFPAEYAHENIKTQLKGVLDIKEKGEKLARDIHEGKITEPHEIHEKIREWLLEIPHKNGKNMERSFRRFIDQEALIKTQTISRFLEEGKMPFVKPLYRDGGEFSEQNQKKQAA